VGATKNRRFDRTELLHRLTPERVARQIRRIAILGE
jgi:hypothetical protein